MDDTTTDKAAGQKHVLHDDIILVGIDSQMMTFFIGPIDYTTANALCLTRGCDSVNHPVFSVGKPGTFNLTIGWVNVHTLQIHKDTDDKAFMLYDIIDARFNVFPDNGLWRPASSCPLARIAVLCHEDPSLFIDPKNLRKIFLLCMSN